MSESVLYKEIIKKLERKTKRGQVFMAYKGALITVLLCSSVFFVITLAESLFHFSSGVRTVLFFLFILSVVGSAAYLVAVPLLKYFRFFRRTDYFSEAAEVGSYFPSLKDELLNAMQLVSGSYGSGYSSELIDAAFRRIYFKSEELRFEEVIDFRKVKSMILYAAGVLLLMLMLIVLVPGLASASSRLYNFSQDFIPPPEFVLNVFPGDAQASKGDNITVKITASGIIPKEVYAAVKSEAQTDFKPERLTADSSGVFEYTINSIRSSVDYYAYSGDISSRIYRIEVSDKPLIKNLEITVTPPAYTGLPEITQTDNGNISAIMGSRAYIRISSNKELRKAELSFGDSVVKNLEVRYSSASGRFILNNETEYRIHLADAAGSPNESPVTYKITLLEDEYPQIEFTEPGADVDLANDNRLPLGIKISDDFGFSRLLVRYRLSESRYEKPHKDYSVFELAIPERQKEAEISYIWNLSSLNLATDDVVSYYAEVSDNDRVSGPKSSRSPEFKIRIPSLDEILVQADQKHSQVANDLEKTLKEAEELKKTLDKISNDLKQDKKELSWEEKEKIENALDKFEQLQDKLQKSAEDMNELRKDLQKNNLLSKETLEKYMELQKLFEELSGDEFKKAMDQLRNLLEKMDRKSAMDSFENLKVNEENLRKGIERTINLLKRVRIEQKVEELVKRSGEVDKNLEDIMKESNPSQNSLRKQENMTAEMKNIEKEMEKLLDEMEGLDDMPKDEMEKISEEFNKQENEKLSSEALENLKQNLMQQARQKQSQLSKNMKNFAEEMQQLQQQLQQQSQMQVFSDMMRILENLITLSKKQEELIKESMNFNDSPSSRNAEKQTNLQRNLDNLIRQLGELSQKTFAVTPEMGKALGDAKREMTKSTQAIQSKNGSLAANSQQDAMKSLNEAASSMQSSMEAMMQAGGGGGMSLMQQLGQMAQQQMGLNNLTQKMMQGNQGQLSLSEQAELRRIQEQQELIKKSLEELNREAKLSGESKKIPSNLENIVKQMEEVISDMDTGQLDDNLVQKQERILSRLLDAQRSLNERDFEKQRESFSGENVVRKSPSGLNYGDRQEEKLKDELNRSFDEGYKKDYESLIRSYFEELRKENNRQKPPTD